ncbi:MAG TPA: SDR family oxidoreductase [Solirubrobacteraceae bacterium]|nr:SDR family oxidoreductase [Solirubrobacteraceae bacterium]
MSTEKIAITGATGGMGGRVARLLAERGIAHRVLVREPSRAPDLGPVRVLQFGGYDDAPGMRRALDGARMLFLVSAAEDPDRVALHRSAVDAAVDAGIERIVYTSFVGAAADATFTFARDHHHTERYIESTGVGHTFLRHNLYIDFIPVLCPADGVIRGPAGDGRVAAVARDDIAEVAVAVLTGDGHDGQTYDVTGIEALTLTQAAAELSRVTRRQITFKNETLEEAWESRRPSGAPDWEIEGWITTYTAIAAGDLEVVSDTVERFCDHEPKRLGDWLRENPEAWRHLVHTS